MDCSALVSEILRSVGELPPGEHNAQSLFNHYSEPANHIGQDPTLGALCFYGASKTLIDHVTLCLNRRLCIEAGGGGPTIKSLDDAALAGAYVKVRTIWFDNSFQGCFLPEYVNIDV